MGRHILFDARSDRVCVVEEKHLVEVTEPLESEAVELPLSDVRSRNIDYVADPSPKIDRYLSASVALALHVDNTAVVHLLTLIIYDEKTAFV